ncbi:hypothetical protein [Flagellimonas marinaquae]|uniref:hypothetical protein n=1 Tax=Flagellimonas marinaquae TaxID=254955 RepID=UPI002076038F|nr:hypothetical protein [Allomuricauda aquimarina]USD26860.1 hypothetical protein MJO53_08175 [Allomuricauda aquimarina]
MKSTEGIIPKPIIRKRKFNGNPINNTRRVQRVLDLITFLNEFKTIKEIKDCLEIHEKSVQRYLNLLVQLGFNVEVKFGKYYSYRITNTKSFFKVA